MIKYYLISIVTSFRCICNRVWSSLSCGFYKRKHNMQDHAIKLTHLFSHATASINVRLPREFAATTGSPLTIRHPTETFDYSRVKFVVHYFLGGSLLESDHSLLNSAGTAARTARVRARCVSKVVMSVESSEETYTVCALLSLSLHVFIYVHWKSRTMQRYTHNTKQITPKYVTHSTEWCWNILFIKSHTADSQT